MASPTLPYQPGLYFGYAKSANVDPRAAISVLALTTIAATTVILLSYFNVVANLTSIAQWTLVGAGAGAAITSVVLGTAHFAHIKRHARQEALRNISEEELQQKLIAISQLKNPMPALHQLADDIPFERLQELFKTHFDGSEDAFAAVKDSLGQAHAFLQASAQVSPSVKARLWGIFNALFAAIDSFFVAFGIAEFFDPPEGKFDSGFKFQKIIMIVSLFTLLTSTLLPMFGAVNGSAIVGGSLIGISILSVIWPKIRPMPSLMAEGENWTEKAQKGTLKATPARDNEVQQIISKVESNGHVLCIGSSGVGKTETMKAFVQTITDKHLPGKPGDPICTTLHGKVVYYFNTADLAANVEAFGGGNKILKRMMDAIREADRDKCILIFDEVHEAFRGESSFGEKFKTFLDKFPNVIGLTTYEEYIRDIFTHNAAADRRFEKMTLGNTDKNATLAVLSNYVMRDAPGTVLDDPNILFHLYEQTKDQTQPLAALKILAKCVAQISHTPRSDLAAQAHQIQNTLTAFSGVKATFGSAGLKKEHRIKMQAALSEDQTQPITQVALVAKQQDLKTQMESQQHELNELAQAKQHLCALRKSKFHLIDTCKHLDAETDPPPEYTAQLADFILDCFFEESLEIRVKELAKKQKVQAVLTIDLVNKTIQEEKDNEAKRLSAMQNDSSRQAARLEAMQAHHTTHRRTDGQVILTTAL